MHITVLTSCPCCTHLVAFRKRRVVQSIYAHAIHDPGMPQDSPFEERLRGLLLMVPPGKFTTYKELARKLGSSPRAVGQALKRNKHPVIVPCHRVIKSDLSLGGYFGTQRLAAKERLLIQEGLTIEDNQVVGTDRMYIFN